MVNWSTSALNYLRAVKTQKTLKTKVRKVPSPSSTTIRLQSLNQVRTKPSSGHVPSSTLLSVRKAGSRTMTRLSSLRRVGTTPRSGNVLSNNPQHARKAGRNAMTIVVMHVLPGTLAATDVTP